MNLIQKLAVFEYVKEGIYKGKGNSKRVTRRAMLHIPKLLIISILHYFNSSFLTKFATNAS